MNCSRKVGNNDGRLWRDQLGEERLILADDECVSLQGELGISPIIWPVTMDDRDMEQAL